MNSAIRTIKEQIRFLKEVQEDMLEAGDEYTDIVEVSGLLYQWVALLCELEGA